MIDRTNGLDKASFCKSLIFRLALEAFDSQAQISNIRGYDGNPPIESNNYCCVDATEVISEFRGIVCINEKQYCFIAQIKSDDTHRARFIPTEEVLEDPTGKPRKMQSVIQKMILERKQAIMLVPDNESDALDIISGLIEQGFHDIASEYREFIISQIEKTKAAKDNGA